MNVIANDLNQKCYAEKMIGSAGLRVTINSPCSNKLSKFRKAKETRWVAFLLTICPGERAEILLSSFYIVVYATIHWNCWFTPWRELGPRLNARSLRTEYWIMCMSNLWLTHVPVPPGVITPFQKRV